MSLKYLPPYSPERNPTELALAQLKAKIRAARPRPSTRHQMRALITDVLNGLNGKSMQPLYNEMRRFLQRAAAHKQLYD